MSYLDSVYMQTLKKVKFTHSNIKKHNILSVSTDWWSNDKVNNYVGTTCQYIDENYKMHKIVRGVCLIERIKNEEKINEVTNLLTDNILDAQLELEKILTTDNG